MNGDIDAMDFVTQIILNNTRLNYDKDELTMDNDKIILEVLKVLAKEKYEARLQELLEKEKSKEI